MKKTKKKKDKIPPLSLLDKCIYGVLFVLSIIIPIILNAVFDILRESIAFSGNALAYSSNLSYLWVLPFSAIILISTFVFVIVSIDNKRPIFGKKSAVYQNPPYPIIGKNKKKACISKSNKALNKILFKIWLVVVAVTLSLVPLSLCGRDSLTEKGVEKHNLFNQVVDSYDTDDISEITIRCRYDNHYRTAKHPVYEVIIKVNDRDKFFFSNRDFDGRNDNYNDIAINKMLELKSSVPDDIISIEGKEHLEETISYYKLSKLNADKLRTLFE